MTATARLDKLQRRLGQPVMLRLDPADATAGHVNVPADVGRGLWVVAIDRPGPDHTRILDGLGAGPTPREAIKAAECALDRRLVDAEHRNRTDQAAERARGDRP